MKSLLSNYVLSILSGWTDFLENIKKITENCGELNSQNDEENIFPVEIYGLEGASVSFFAGKFIESSVSAILQKMQYAGTGRYSSSFTASNTANLSSSGDFVFIVPTEREALEITED